MKKLRWASEGGFWELDMSTPATLDGLAKPVGGEGHLLPLGVSRGSSLTRAKQLHFMHTFMSMPFVPSFSPNSHGLSLHRLLSFPFLPDPWFATLLGQFNLQKFVSSIKDGGPWKDSEASWLKSIGKHLCDKSLYALSFCSELLVTPIDTVLVSSEAYADKMTPRNKVVLRHEFPNDNLTVEGVWPGLFIDKLGNYWDIPLSMAIDLASMPSDSGPSYHVCVQHNSGTPTLFQGDETHIAPPSLLPGVCVKTAFSFKKNIDIWRSHAQKVKLVQPFDVFLSNPHITASGIIGAVVNASFGDSSVRLLEDNESHGFRGFSLHVPKVKSAVLGDIFATASLTAQHGNFQRLLLDLTRFHARLDFPSGSKLLLGSSHLIQDLLNSQQPSMDVIQAICPTATLSLQQQIAGPFSLRVDSRVAVDWKKGEWRVGMDDSVFAVEYAMQVLGSAKATAWYSPKHKEFMVELRFFET